MSVTLQNVRLPLAHFTLEADVSFSAQVTGLFGPSGSGKTSLLEIIAGLRRPATGRVSVDGDVLTDAAAGVLVPTERRATGYLPQDDALFPHLSVRRNLLYGRQSQRAYPADLSYEHVTDVLEIRALAGRSVGTLSGGERQRIALGRALLAAPRLLLLDEPLARLDAALKERLLPYLRRVREEFALPIVYVTHSPDEVVALCDEVLVLEQGRIERRGRPTELFAPAASPRYELRPAPPDQP